MPRQEIVIFEEMTGVLYVEVLLTRRFNLVQSQNRSLFCGAVLLDIGRAFIKDSSSSISGNLIPKLVTHETDDGNHSKKYLSSPSPGSYNLSSFCFHSTLLFIQLLQAKMLSDC